MRSAVSSDELEAKHNSQSFERISQREGEIHEKGEDATRRAVPSRSLQATGYDPGLTPRDASTEVLSAALPSERRIYG